MRLSLSRVKVGLVASLLVAGCAGEDGGGSEGLKFSYNQVTGRVIATVGSPLGSSEAIHVAVRRGSFGQIDCGKVTGEPAMTADETGLKLSGPAVDPELLKPFYGPDWALNPTPAMLAQAELGTNSIIDACIVKDGRVVQQLEIDLMQAWDSGRAAGIGGKSDSPNGETRINSAQKYGERCVAELGEIPFFEKNGEGDYGTYNCLDSTPIPMTVTKPDGTVESPDETSATCDKPQYIYSLCEQGPRVASRTNEQGTRWVLLCRKSIGGLSSSKFNDIAMIGHNPYTGKTCFFQNALYQKTDGAKIPHPADKRKSTNLWEGVHGGQGSGIECAKCHDADAFIHTPWIDGAKDANGRTIVPKMGEDDDYPIGANDAPYTIVNTAGQGWTMPKMLVSPEANACMKCHRMGNGRWLEWSKRLDGTDTAFRGITTAEYLKFQKLHWMPPELEGLTESTFAASPVGKALAFIKGCNASASACNYQPMPGNGPSGPATTGGKLRNPVMLADRELATKSLQILGANVTGTSNRCNECHSLTRHNLRQWQTLTDGAVSGCLAETSGGEARNENFANQNIGRSFKTFGPFDVAAGGTFSAEMTGTGDADLYVKKGAEVTTEVYDCRPYGGDSNETCGREQFQATGPGKFYVGVNGYGEDNVINLKITYTVPGATMTSPKKMVDCLRHDPTRQDSPFVPGKAGIYSAAAHLGWFQDLFKAAYPGDAGVVELAKFKLRVGMPKGNHPRLTQDELDIVAEWFARGLPQLDATLPEDPPPSACTPSIGAGLTQHLTQMRTTGWAAVNRERGMNMYGCASGQVGKDCLTSAPRATSKAYGMGWEKQAGAKLRILRELSYNTFFWMRSSADGRFVANGATGGPGAMIADLVQNRDIPTQASYDPGFFPDNSGFVFQGTQIGAAFCNNSLLTSSPMSINFSESQCTSASSVGLYQHLGAGLGGADYFIVNSQFESDNGGHSATLEDPSAGFASTAQIKLTPMVQSGNRYQQGTSVSFVAPFEGDTVLSPSTRLLISRLSGPGSKQMGYVLRKMTATPGASGYTVSAPEVARVCTKGAKPALSFDERFMVFHHYVEAEDFADLGFASASDPAFQQYVQKGAANIMVVDLSTGARTIVTSMKPGQYALFPHFRSDGWIYFLVRDSNSNKEYVVASDAALVLGQ